MTRRPFLVSKYTIQFGGLPGSLDDKLQIATKANEIISYVVASHLKYHYKAEKESYDAASYGDVHKRNVVIDTAGSPALVGLKDLLDFLYGAYNNDLKRVQPRLAFRPLTQQEKRQNTLFDLGLTYSARPVQYELISVNKKLSLEILKEASTVSVLAAARRKDPASQIIGRILGEAKQTVFVGGPGAVPDNVMVNTAETAKKFGSNIGFITAKFIFQKQRSLRIDPDFVLVARTMCERTCLMYGLGHLLIALPGGIAVVEEVLTAIVCNIREQIDKRSKKPIVLWNQGGHWDTLYAWLKIIGLADEVELLDTENQLYRHLK